MTDLPLTPQRTPTTTQGRPRRRHSFYMSNQWAAVARGIAERETERTGMRTGPGQIIDRALRNYAVEALAPEELAQLLQDLSAQNGHAND